MAQLKDSLITGDLRVTGTIYGLVDKVNDVVDYNDGKPTKFGYSTSGMTSASWIGAWDATTSGEYRLRAISPQNLRNTMGLGNTTGALPVANGGTGQTTAAGIFNVVRDNGGNSAWVNVSGDTMTGFLTLHANPTSNLHAATKQYVDNAFAANDAMIFKGIVNANGDLPANHKVGWTYRVGTAGTYAGVACEIGDLIICITDGTAANNAHWTVAQTNIDGAVIGPTSATDGNFALFNGTTGKLIKNSSYSPSSFAAAGHTHTTSLASDTGTSAVTLTSGGKFKLTAGGTSIIFTMPTSNNYTHPTTSGNKHIPSGGSSGQFLGWDSDGTAKWVNNPNTNYYHKTGSWSGLTYTAGKVGSPDDLVFTIPTGTSATTVAVGNHTHSAIDIKGGYMNTHPENSPVIIPFLNNDIAFNNARGGNSTIYSTTATSFTAANLAKTKTVATTTSIFDGSGSYQSGFGFTTGDTVVLDITCYTKFSYSTTIYIDFGNAGWAPTGNVDLYLMNSATETSYVSKGSFTNASTYGHAWFNTSHSSTSNGETVQGFDKIRLVLFNVKNTLRISQVGVINYGSQGTRQTYMSRGVDDEVWRSITPSATGTYSLGTSSKKWANVYADAFTGSFNGTATNANYVNLYEARGTTTTLNKAAAYIGNGKMFHLVASSSTSSTDNGKPPMGDANIFQMNWDNAGGFDAQLAISTAANRMEFRDQPSNKKAWREVVTSTPGTAAGGTTTPVYISDTGVATAVTLTGETSLRNSLGLGTGNGALAVANGGTGQTSIANIQAGKDGDGNTISSTYLKLSGGTMTGQLKTSFKSSVAMGTYAATATTIGNLCEELRYSSGAAGSVSISTAYTKDGITIATGWYNFLWIPHRSGGVNGAASGDNCNYGSLYLSGMTVSGLYMIRYASGAIAELKNLYTATKLASTGTTAQFWRGDNTWSDTISGGLLKITNSSTTLSIGAANTSWVHFTNTAGYLYYFDKQVNAVGGFKVYNTSTALTDNSLTFSQGGGWNMSDSTWIRSVGNKSIYQNSGTLRTDGTLQVGNNGAYLNANSSGVSISPRLTMTSGKPINQLLTGTGTAATTSGSNYVPAKWTFNAGVTVTDGDIFTIKIPVAGHDYGVFMSVNNGTNYYPVVVSGTGRVTTHYPVNNYIQVVFESAGSAASMFPLAGGTSRVTVSGGAFRVLNYYDSGNSGLYQNYNPKAFKIGTTAVTAYDLLAEDVNGLIVPAHKVAHRVGSPIYIATSGKAANATGTWWDMYDRHYNMTLRKDGSNLSMTAYNPVYLKGTITGNIFTPDTTTPYVFTTAGCNVTGAYYMYIGDATTSTSCIAYNNSHTYYYYNGSSLVHWTQAQSGPNIYYNSGTQTLHIDYVSNSSITTLSQTVSQLTALHATSGGTMKTVAQEIADNGGTITQNTLLNINGTQFRIQNA